MADGYFEHVRDDIAGLLPSTASEILEIGCASGVTLKWLKGRYPAARTTGVDGHAPMKPLIEAAADTALIANFDDPMPSLGRYDLILALDVLEHLRDAEGVLSRLVDDHLAPGGTVIVSLPAVSHYSVSLPLLFKREFTYCDEGILDRTHLRFFVEQSCVQLMNDAGLVVQDGRVSGFQGKRAKVLDSLSGGALRHWLTKQYIMRGAKAGGGQPPVQWKRAQ
jgi:cyclopropane fatty-acyl-phospholipid synthase-like methyltransferase